MDLARRFDDELEDLRKNAERGDNVDLMTKELEGKTWQIHVAFLFEEKGFKILQTLCLYIGAEKVGRVYTNWYRFASELGLTRQQIENIENYFSQEGPVYLTLGTYAQQEDATINKVIQILEDIGRKDVIGLIYQDVLKLVECLSDRINSKGIVKPYRKPPVPLVLRTLNKPRITNVSSINLNNRQTNGSRTVFTPKQNPRLAARVLLTFADDGKETAQRVADIFRSYEPKIGVAILEESPSNFYTETTQYINYLFKKVDAIIPILSKRYFDKIDPLRKEKNLLSPSSLDDEYVEYIYRSFENELINDDCKCYRVRCILQNGFTRQDIPKGHLVLAAWFPEVKIPDLIKLLLKEKKEARRAKQMIETSNTS